MRSHRPVFALAMAGALTLAACAPTGSGGGLGDSCGDLGWGRVGGTLAGAALGGALGSTWSGAGRSTMTAATIGGAALGALGGFFAGRAIDEGTCQRAQMARQQAYSAPIGQPIQWSGNSGGGTFTPMREGTSAWTPPQGGQPTNLYCREIVMDGRLDGKPIKYIETACRMPDGTWRRSS